MGLSSKKNRKSKRKVRRGGSGTRKGGTRISDITDVENNPNYYELKGVNFYDTLNDKVLNSHILNNLEVRVFKKSDDTDTDNDKERANNEKENKEGLYNDINIAKPEKTILGNPQKLPRRNKKITEIFNEGKFQKIVEDQLLFFYRENENEDMKQVIPSYKKTSIDFPYKDGVFIKSRY